MRVPLGFAAAALVLVAGVPTSSAAEDAWATVGPGGGGAFNSPCLTDDAWVVGTDLGGLYRSTDDGRTWSQIGAQAGLTQTHVSATACLADGRVVIGTEAGIYLLDGSGTVVTPAVIAGGSTPYVTALVQTADPEVLVAAVHPVWDGLNPRILRSTDGGSTWNRVAAAGLPRHRRVVALRAHPVDPDAVIVVTGNSRFRPTGTSGPGQAWRTVDGGATFERLANDLGEVLDIVFTRDPERLDEMLLTSRTRGLWRSVDAGDSWGRVASRTGVILPAPVGTIRLFDADRAGWETPTAGVWESTAAGAAGTWSRVSDLADWSSGWSHHIEWWGVGASYQGLLQTAAGTTDGSTLLWTDSQFVYASDDGARSFHGVTSSRTGSASWTTRGIDNAVATAAAPSRVRAGLVFIGYQDLGLWRSRDGGATWQALRPRGVTRDWGGGRLGGNSLTVLTDPARAGRVWASFGGDVGIPGNTRLLRSTDGGDRWTRVRGLPRRARQISGLALDPRSAAGRRTLTVIVDNDVYRSRDDGRSWALAYDGCRGCELSWSAGGRTYAGGSGGLWRSAGGRAWSRVRLPGVSWQGPGDHPAPFFESGYRGVADLARVGDETWVAVTGRGFLRSRDDGATWMLARRDHHARTVTGLRGRVVVGSSSAFRSGGWDPVHPSAGVLVSQSGDPGSWSTLNKGLAYPFAVSVRIGAGGVLWALSPGQGVARRD